MDKITAPVTNPTKDSKLDASAGLNSHDNEKVKIYHNKIQEVIDHMEADVKASKLLPDAIFLPLFDKLRELSQVINPTRSLICYCVGNTDAGKSSLINALSKSHVCPVSDSFEAGTNRFQTVSVPEINTLFVDTVGFGSNIHDHALVRKFEEEIEKTNSPDIVLLIVSRADLRRVESLKNAIDYINFVLAWTRNKRNNVEVPVMCVLTKLDEYFPGQKLESEIHGKKTEEYISRALEIINMHLNEKVTKAIAVSSVQNYGIEELILSMNAQSPLNAQIMVKNVEYVEQCRLAMANKIIAAFSTACAAVSFLPGVDLVITTILQEWMYRMLACFSIDPERTPDQFKVVHKAQTMSSLVVRTVALMVGGVFQLSIVGYLIGSGICVVAASSTTAILGWKCYYYFVDK